MTHSQRYRPYPYFALLDDDQWLHGESIISSIFELIQQRRYHQARLQTKDLIEHTLEGLRYLQTYAFPSSSHAPVLTGSQVRPHTHPRDRHRRLRWLDRLLCRLHSPPLPQAHRLVAPRLHDLLLHAARLSPREAALAGLVLRLHRFPVLLLGPRPHASDSPVPGLPPRR